MAQSLNLFLSSTSHSPKPLISHTSAPNFLTPKLSITKSTFPNISLSLRASQNGAGGIVSLQVPSDSGSIDVDSVTEAELKENGFRSTRRTKLICTIGPATCEAEQLEALAVGGMNVARINMCHGTREWHKEVIQRLRKLNEEKGYAVAIMMDTEGSEIHMGDLGGSSSVKAEVPCVSVLDVRMSINEL